VGQGNPSRQHQVGVTNYPVFPFREAHQGISARGPKPEVFPLEPGLLDRCSDLGRVTERYHAPEPDAGAGLSGAPPTETGPKGLGSAGVIFRDLTTSRTRAFGRGMLEVVNGDTAPCSASTCDESAES
jgi:hypothetical protein